MSWRAVLLAAVLAIPGSAWAAPVRDGVTVLATVPAATQPPNPDLQISMMNSATSRLFNTEIGVETTLAGAATFRSRWFTMSNGIDLPGAKWAAFTEGARKAFDWCRTIETENVTVEKHVGHYTAIGASGKWEGLSLAVHGVRNAGCAVRITGYQYPSGRMDLYVAPRDALKLGGTLSAIPATARALREERARAAAVREQLQ
ncbi:hypothetical protein C882_2026 [Caenispirillum salinarum AK4]|uniref:Sensor domain-containing protein n=2 Tax=Caenispirillum TaxID=414051 RepID=K9GPQ5_9PROT|nr:hypothetical protein C882_2026 [Caenispirillum salinarum AK4]